MKTQFTYRYLDGSQVLPLPITRERVAYLLRAARSRRNHNLKVFTGYYIADALMSITRAA